MKVIQTEYKGYLFRSRLEARWAVFFDACGVDWEYEREGYILSDGSYYLPDFLLHGLVGRYSGDLFVEVKGNMSAKDAHKIKLFSGRNRENLIEPIENPILVVSRIPCGSSISEMDYNTSLMAYESEHEVYPFNFELVDGDHFAVHMGLNKTGGFELFGDDSSYLADRDDIATEHAYKLALQARFEYKNNLNLRR